MPKIINAYAEGQNSIADSLKSIGQSIWGDEAKNEGYRQHARKESLEADKAARENNAAEPYARSLRDNDAASTRYYGALHGLPPAGIASGNLLSTAGHANGNLDDPLIGTAMVGAGHPVASTPEGQRRSLENARMQPTYGITSEDPAGNKTYGWRDPRTRTVQPDNGQPYQGQAEPGFGMPGAGALPPGGAQPRGGFNSPPAQPGTPQVGYQPTSGVQQPQTADMYLTDEHGQPMNIQPAPLHMAQSATDENGQPLLSPQGQQALQAIRQKYGDGYTGRVLATIMGHAAAPNSRSKANNAFMNDVYSVYPNFDYGVNASRNATYKDIASSGKTGQMTTALDQGVHHMAGELIPKMDALGMNNTFRPFEGHGLGARIGNAVAAPFTAPTNAAKETYMHASADPRLAAADVAREGFGNEFAKLFRTTGMAEQDVQRNLAMFRPGQSPQELRATVATAIGLLRGSFASRENTINRVLGPDAQRPPLINGETAGLLDAIEKWTQGGPMPPVPVKAGGSLPAGPVPGGGGTQPAQALPPGPTGHPPSANDKVPLPPAGSRSSFEDRFSAVNEDPLIAEGREAIQRGANRTQVMNRIRQKGKDPTGL